MDFYYVNKNQQPTGKHEVHKAGCTRLKEVKEKTSLSLCGDCHEAVRRAKRIFNNANACFYCCKECHTK